MLLSSGLVLRFADGIEGSEKLSRKVLSCRFVE